ncbi:hypothetical protein FHS29_006402 [Saccharothrix tamanrassetensis]|uniref:Lipoprotein n=1 Tax=Saccharothrix tamanrassetensis TaxID=1051531 RepID=A0A841CQ04_9PSEU|nr:hypothetical protein [Saccharothrix tamanrassetensis]MBB5959781.1 hypothetical protein [Saccharothrix tamanrassetensis]
MVPAVLIALAVLTACAAGEPARTDGAPPASNQSEAPVRTGPPLDITDDDGFRFRLEGTAVGRSATVPDIGHDGEQSAPPGEVFVYADLFVTNLQADRPGPLEDYLERWYLQVPKTAADDGRLPFCDEGLPGFCGHYAACYRLDLPLGDADLSNLEEESFTMAPGARWPLRCYLGRGSFGSYKGVVPVAEDAADQIHFVRMKQSWAQTEERQELAFPTN